MIVKREILLIEDAKKSQKNNMQKREFAYSSSFFAIFLRQLDYTGIKRHFLVFASANAKQPLSAIRFFATDSTVAQKQGQKNKTVPCPCLKPFPLECAKKNFNFSAHSYKSTILP